MSVLNRIACFQGRRDEVPNQELARDLATANDGDGIREIAENLWNKDRNVQSDCLKVLYEVGYLAPELIADYAGDFMKLLASRNNRLVWGAMIALSTVAPLRADDIFQHLADVKNTMEQGTVITVDAGVKTLAGVASRNDVYCEAIFPYLLRHLDACRLKDVPQHAEKVLVAVNERTKRDFIVALERRMPDMTSSQAARIRRVIREAEKR